MSHAESQVPKVDHHLQSLDSLRGILALVVFVCHVYMGFFRPANGAVVTAAQEVWELVARLAVVFFFCLSGFVIAMSLARNCSEPGGFKVGRFVLSRLARVVPPLLATIAATSLMAAALDALDFSLAIGESVERTAYSTSVTDQLISMLTLTLAGDLRGQAFNGPLWSLAYEIRFYVAAGLLAIAMWNGSSPGRVLALGALVAWMLAIDMGAFFGANYQQGTMLVAFGAGAVAFRLRHAADAWMAAGLVIASVLAAAAAVHAQASAPRLLDTFWGWSAFQCLSAVAFCCAMNLVSMLDRLRPLAWLGRSSYTLYILHFPILQFFYFMVFNAAPSWLNEPWNGLTAVIAASATFWCCLQVAKAVEQPAAARRWLTHLMGRSSAVVSAIRR